MTVRTTTLVIGAGLLASIGLLGSLTGGSSAPRRQPLEAARALVPPPRALADESARTQPEPAAPRTVSQRSVTKPAAAVPPSGPDPFYDAAACPSLEVIRALETASGSEALVEVAAPAGALRLRLGDEVDGRLLTFVGPHPKDGRLTVVLEGPSGACSAALRSDELALQRADRQASLSPEGDIVTGEDRRNEAHEALARQSSEFSQTLGSARGNPGDFAGAEN